ncbi:MAG: DUF2961 domain-containing protein, partial [Clostridia bacterium]|nr:DUF2961 domain-containing protein [Clostridia bacterium]
FFRFAFTEYNIPLVLGNAYTIAMDVYKGEQLLFTGSTTKGQFSNWTKAPEIIVNDVPHNYVEPEPENLPILGIYNEVLVGQTEKNGETKNTATILGSIRESVFDEGSVVYDSIRMTLSFTSDALTQPKTFTIEFKRVYSTVRNVASTNAETAAAHGIIHIDDDVYLYALEINGIDLGSYSVDVSLVPILNGEEVTEEKATATIAFKVKEVGDYDYTYTDIVNRMLDARALSCPASGERSYEATSYDRSSAFVNGNYTSWSANGDGSGYIAQTDDGGILIAEMNGPGYISRIWSATASSGRVKVFIDGEITATIDLSFADYFNCTKAPFIYAGLCYNDTARGQNSYLPITFSESCRVVAYGDWGQYYHVNYTLFPEGTNVERMPRALTEEQETALAAVNEFFLAGIGSNPSGAADAAFEEYTIAKNVPVQKTLTGAGAIDSILFRVDLPDEKYAIDTVNLLKSIKLKIYFDGMQDASVDAPLGDFFGSAYGMTDVQTLLLGVRDDGTFYSYFYMPYLSEARIELSYIGEGTIDIQMAVSAVTADRTDNDIMYFCASFTNGSYEDTRWPDHGFLSATGEGRLVGLTLHSSKFSDETDPGSGAGSHWWGEGDEKFFVDGEEFPSWFGTGTEDFFGYAWCDSNLFSRAYHAQSYCFGGAYSKGNRSLTRLLVTDSIPFYDSFGGYLEKYYSDDYVTYGYTAYYYLAPGSTASFEEVPNERLLTYFTADPGSGISNLVEGEYLRFIGSDSTTISQAPQLMDYFEKENWSGYKQLFIKGLGIGQYAEYTLPAISDGRYMILASFTTAPDYGKLRVSVNGTELGEEIDCYTASVLVEYLTEIGEATLTAGNSNTIRFTVTGKNASSGDYYIGLDFLLLIPAEDYSGTENVDLSEYCEVTRKNAKNDAASEYVFEGEDLVTGSVVSEGSVTAQNLAHLGPYWSGDRQLWWKNGTVSSTLTLTVDVAEAGDYAMSGAFTKASDYGTADIYVNGQKIASDLDFYNGSVVHYAAEFGVVTLPAGSVEITILITGKNASAVGYMIGVDYFAIKKVTAEPAEPILLTDYAIFTAGRDGVTRVPTMADGDVGGYYDLGAWADTVNDPAYGISGNCYIEADLGTL